MTSLSPPVASTLPSLDIAAQRTRVSRTPVWATFPSGFFFCRRQLLPLRRKHRYHKPAQQHDCEPVSLHVSPLEFLALHFASTRRIDLMNTVSTGTLSAPVRTNRILSTTSMPSVTLPN